MANVTWTKLRDGSWGLRSDAALESGATVTVTKKNGTSSPATVGNRIASDGATWWLYTVAAAPKAAKSDESSSRGRGCSHCRQTASRNTQIWEECEYCGNEPIYI